MGLCRLFDDAVSRNAEHDADLSQRRIRYQPHLRADLYGKKPPLFLGLGSQRCAMLPRFSVTIRAVKTRSQEPFKRLSCTACRKPVVLCAPSLTSASTRTRRIRGRLENPFDCVASQVENR